MTEFFIKEVRRFMDTIEKTDPCSDDYSHLLYNFKEFVTVSGTLDDVLALLEEHSCECGCGQCGNDGENSQKKCENSSEDSREKCEDNVIPFPVPEESPLPETVEEPPVCEADEQVAQPQIAEAAQVSVDTPIISYTLEQVRAALVSARRTKGLNLTEFFRGFGYSNMTDLPPDLYPKVMAKLEAM